SKAKYAVRAAVHLAGCAPEGAWAQAAAIAAAESIPRKFLEMILVQLRDHGVVESRRGAQGGYRLLRAPARAALARIIRIVDSPPALTRGASRTRYRPCTDCVAVSRCRLQPVMQQARDAVAAVLEQCSLAALADAPASRRRAVVASGGRAS